MPTQAECFSSPISEYIIATTASNQYKSQVTSCQSCNEKYGALENDLLTRLSICLEPSDPACAGIAEKGFNLLNQIERIKLTPLCACGVRRLVPASRQR